MNLTIARTALSELSKKAAQVAALLALLAEKRLWLSADKAADEIASRLYGNPDYTYGASYSSADSLAAELKYELSEDFVIEEREGLRCLVILPFSGQSIAHASALDLGYLMSVGGVVRRLSDLCIYPPYEAGNAVTGLSAAEEHILVRGLAAKSVTLFNALIDVSISLSYTMRARRQDFGALAPTCVVGEDPGIDDLLGQLCEAASLPGVAAPKWHASSNNKIKALPEDFLAALARQ